MKSFERKVAARAVGAVVLGAMILMGTAAAAKMTAARRGLSSGTVRARVPFPWATPW